MVILTRISQSLPFSCFVKWFNPRLTEPITQEDRPPRHDIFKINHRTMFILVQTLPNHKVPGYKCSVWLLWRHPGTRHMTWPHRIRSLILCMALTKIMTSVSYNVPKKKSKTWIWAKKFTKNPFWSWLLNVKENEKFGSIMLQEHLYISTTTIFTVQGVREKKMCKKKSVLAFDV